MAYTKTVWADGDVITAEKLNHMEGGMGAEKKWHTGDVITEQKLNGSENSIAALEDIFAGLIDRSLTSVVIPEGVTSIGGSAFNKCSGLTSIVIPEGVTSIGSVAFNNCSGLTSMTVKALNPPSLGSYAIQSTISTIYVPTSSVEAYKAASGWSDFASKIQPIPEE